MDYEKAFKEASEKLPRERLVKCACDCALINIDLIKPYTDKFDLIKNFLVNPKIADSTDAWDAASDADAAADAAAEAAYTADAAYAADWADAAAYADWAADATHAAGCAAKVSETSKNKVEKLINDMLSEAKEC